MYPISLPLQRLLAVILKKSRICLNRFYPFATNKVYWIMNYSLPMAVNCPSNAAKTWSETHDVLVGDANGADKAAQTYLFKNNYKNVIVYCSGYIFDNNWKDKALKQRMKHISASLHHYLPMQYSDAIQILMKSSSKFRGFQYMFFPGFVERYGLNQYETSIQALEHFTKHSSSEFAVRPFITKYNHKMMAQMEVWAESDNHPIRRLASEGCRPRLPWATALPEFKQDPAPILPILEKLKNDESEYVRRSVANNLNDISKDHPQ